MFSINVSTLSHTCMEPSGTLIVAETNFPSQQEAKIFPNKFRNILVAEKMFLSLFQNVSGTRNVVFFAIDYSEK